MNQTITIIITTYKRPQLLKRAVNSVLQQTHSDFQLCVYDNASGDETAEIMNAFVKKDSRVKYHQHPQNIGMMANYEYGLSRVNTPYFCFLSDDDYLLPNFFKTALEGFREHPEAAFSACGVLAVDEKGKIVANPLSNWKREGLFTVPEGILEMIRVKGNLPIPTAILFQHSKVKDISPDWSDDIRLMWDPDYLIQIASQHPIVINKEISAIYLAHASAFSASFYAEIRGSSQGLDTYMKAIYKMLERIIKNPYLTVEVKEKVKETFVNMIRKEISVYMRHYIAYSKFSEAHNSANTLNHYFDIDRRIKSYIALTNLCTAVPILKPFVSTSLRALRKTVRHIREIKRSLFRPEEKVHQYHVYGESLLK